MEHDLRDHMPPSPITTFYHPTRSRVVAGVFALLLGAFGVHKFYLGYFSTGFIMLSASLLLGMISFGVAAAVVWVIGVVEGIVYLSMSQEEFDDAYVRHRRVWF